MEPHLRALVGRSTSEAARLTGTSPDRPSSGAQCGLCLQVRPLSLPTLHIRHPRVKDPIQAHGRVCRNISQVTLDGDGPVHRFSSVYSTVQYNTRPSWFLFLSKRETRQSQKVFASFRAICGCLQRSLNPTLVRFSEPAPWSLARPDLPCPSTRSAKKLSRVDHSTYLQYSTVFCLNPTLGQFTSPVCCPANAHSRHLLAV